MEDFGQPSRQWCLEPPGARGWQARSDGELCVLQGPVWLTREGDPDDHVLATGERRRVRRGERWWAGAWQGQRATVGDGGCAARLQWLPAAAPDGAHPAGRRGLRAALADLRGALVAFRAG